MHLLKRFALSAALLCSTASLCGESLPTRLQGSWRITRVLPTTNTSCWTEAQAQPLVGSLLSYRGDVMRWRGGEVALSDVVVRHLTSQQFSKENSGGTEPVSFQQLGIHTSAVTEVDLQHEDMDITGATTEVPGDSILLAGSNRIVIQACGVFFEATRTAAVSRTSLHP